MNVQYRVVEGMAHFAGGGPPGKQCGDCRFYGDGHGHSCHKWREFMRSEEAGPAFDARVAACKYFAKPEKKPKR